MRTQTDTRRSVGTPLGEHTWLRSACFDETASFLRREKSIALRWPRATCPPETFRFDLNLAALPRCYVCYAESSPALEQTWLAPLDFDYVVHVPMDGGFELRVGDRTVQCGAGGAAVVSPSNRLGLTTSDGCRRLLLRVRHQALVDHLIAMLGDLPNEGLVFDPAVDPSRAGSPRLINAVRYAAQELGRNELVKGNDVVLAQFEQFLMTLLLMAQPNNHSDALTRRDNGVRPKDVKKAIDYIHANLGDPILIEDLVAASGVSGRTLYQHFQDFVGASPLGYVRKVRYERVRDDLKRSNGERTVTEIAGRWGFTHMGRFAAGYHRRFGELPSVTARRRKPPKG